MPQEPNYKDVFDVIPLAEVIVQPRFDELHNVIGFHIIRENPAYTNLLRMLTAEEAKAKIVMAELKTFPCVFNKALQTFASKKSFDFEFDSKCVNTTFYLNAHLFEGGLYLFTLKGADKNSFPFVESDSEGYLDSLTGIPNRAYFNSVFKTALDVGVRRNSAVGIIIIDIDDMKSINDRLGHVAGDSVLRRSAHILQRFADADLQVFRLGDDEFLVLRTNFDSKDHLATLSDVIFDAFQEVGISISAGIASSPFDTDNYTDLLKYADLAVKAAKRNGKNNVVFFEPRMYEAFLRRSLLQQKLIIAATNFSFEQVYQPQFYIDSNRLRGFEALIRWDDVTYGMISPEEFIPIAEETHVITQLGHWVLDSAYSTLARWQKEFGFNGVMSVNVSPTQLKDFSFLGDLTEAMGKYGIPPETLEIEITEGIFIQDLKRTVRILEQIRKLGVLISLDDFGTGYSSFRYLQCLPISTLKIDKAFVENLADKDGNDSVEMRIAESIVTLINRMGLETIAEGVEKNEQLNVLRSMNCTILQGFLTGRPMPQERCERFLAGDLSALDRIGSQKLIIK